MLADDADTIRSSYGQLSGELHGAVRSVQILDSRFVRDAANDRLRSAFGQATAGEDSVMAYASNGAQVMVDATHEGPVFWAQSHGSWGTFDTDAATFSMDRQIGGAMLGGDLSAGRWRVGFLGGYSRTEVREERQQAVSDNTTLGAYAGGRWGKAGVRVGLAQTWHDIETDRSVIMPGLSGTLEADYDGSTRQIFVEGDYALLAHQGSHMEAYANLAQVRSQTDTFGETGGAAALGAPSPPMKCCSPRWVCGPRTRLLWGKARADCGPRQAGATLRAILRSKARMPSAPARCSTLTALRSLKMLPWSMPGWTSVSTRAPPSA